jgi:hypothetical protein
MVAALSRQPSSRACVSRFMWTPLMRNRFAPTACPGSWILSPSCRAAPTSDLMLCAPLLPPLFSCLELVWRTMQCLRARVCSLRGSCAGLCLLSRCRLRLVLLGVAPFRSAPLGVLRLKPRWGRSWSPIWFFALPLPHSGYWNQRSQTPDYSLRSQVSTERIRKRASLTCNARAESSHNNLRRNFGKRTYLTA